VAHTDSQPWQVLSYPTNATITTWNTTLAKIKSANARSGEMVDVGLAEVRSAKMVDFRFAGLTCIRRPTPKINEPMVDIKPDRNELKGNVPTVKQ